MVAARCDNWPVPRVISRIMLWFLVAVCYLGMLIAPGFCCLIALQALHSIPILFWASAALLSGTVLWVTYLGGRRFLQGLGQHLVDLEIAIGLTSFVVAASALAVTLSTRFFFRDF